MFSTAEHTGSLAGRLRDIRGTVASTPAEEQTNTAGLSLLRSPTPLLQQPLTARGGSRLCATSRRLCTNPVARLRAVSSRLRRSRNAARQPWGRGATRYPAPQVRLYRPLGGASQPLPGASWIPQVSVPLPLVSPGLCPSPAGYLRSLSLCLWLPQVSVPLPPGLTGLRRTWGLVAPFAPSPSPSPSPAG